MLTGLFASRHSLPVVLQSESSECGLACVAMVAGYFGHEMSLSVLRREFPVSSEGASLKRIMEVAEAKDLRGRPLKLELFELKQLKLPCILHWDLTHFVVLKKVGRKKIVIHDPAVGERAYTFREISKRFTGIALELTPTATFAQKDEREINKVTDLFIQTPSYYVSIAQIFVLSFLVQLATLFAPFQLLLAFDLGLSRRDNDFLVVLALAFLLVTISRVVVSWIRDHAIVYFTKQIGTQMASNVFHHMLRLPSEYFERRNLNDLLSRFGAIDRLRETISEDVIGSIVDGLFSLMAVVFLFFLSSTLASISLTFYVLYFLSVLVIRPINRERMANLHEQKSKYQAEILSTLKTMRATKLHCSENRVFNYWQAVYAKSVNAEVNHERIKIALNTARGFFFGLEYVAVIYFGSVLINNLELGPGQFMAFIMIKQNLQGSLTRMIPDLLSLRNVKIQLLRLADITFHPPEASEFKLLPFRRPLDGNLVVENLSYTYPGNRSPVLHNVNMKLKSGEMVGVHGASGSGKSTLLHLLCSLISPESGQILVGDMALPDYGLRNYRKHVAAVFHSRILFPGTILSNITMDDEVPDMKRVEEVASLVEIHEHIMTLAMTYQSVINDMEANLSAGQIQRVVLARALYKQPKILFLDEAMSNLEDAMAERILTRIAELGVTVVIVTHSKHVLSILDRVYWVDKGTVSEVEMEVTEHSVQMAEA